MGNRSPQLTSASVTATLIDTLAQFQELQRAFEKLSHTLQQREAQLREELALLELERVLDNNQGPSGSGHVRKPDATLLRGQLAATLRQIEAIEPSRSTVSIAASVLSELSRGLEIGVSVATSLSTVRERFVAAEAREAERAHLSREIHDSPAQIMLNAVYSLRVIEQQAAKQENRLTPSLTQTRELLEDGYAELRRFMFDLHPAGLKERGLAATLERYCQDACQLYGGGVDCEIDRDITLDDSTVTLALFRIAQEAMRNAEKHGGPAARIRISLRREDDLVILEVSDDGKGFESDDSSTGLLSGSGLHMMRERSALIGGSLLIESRPGNGTTVSVSVPAQLPKAERNGVRSVIQRRG